MMFPYMLLGIATLMIVTSVWVAYEIGRRVGAYEARRDYRHPNWRVKSHIK